MKIWLLDKDEQLQQKLTLTKALNEEELNGSNSVSFSCSEKVNKYDRIVYRNNQLKWQEYIIQEVIELRDSNEVYAEHSSYELHGNFMDDKKPTGTPFTHLNVLLDRTRWSIGKIDGFESKFISYYHISVYEGITKLCNVFKAYRTFEIKVKDNKITQRLVNLSMNSGHDEGKRFTYTKDLLGITRTVLSGDIVTSLYGFGRGEEIGDGYGRRINISQLNKPDSPVGSKSVDDESARLLWGRNSSTGKVHVEAKWEFDEIEDVEELYLATKQKLQELNHPRVNYSCNVLLLDEVHENVSIGDTVAIIDHEFLDEEVRLKGKVVKIQRDLLYPERSVIEIGNYIEDISDSDLKLQQFVNSFRDKSGIWDKSNAFDKNGNLEASYIKELLNAWNDEMNGMGGFVYATEGDGIITYDRPHDENPTSAIQIVGGGWRIANSKLPNGEWDWKTVATGDGIYGQQIIAKTITTNQLSSDVGSNLDLSSNKGINAKVEEIKTSIEEIELTPGPQGIPGLKGEPGAKGTPGIDGIDGKTNFTHIAWSNIGVSPYTGFSTTISEGKKYIGMYVSDYETSSEDGSYYHWSKIRGDDGANGVPGLKGDDGRTPYFHTAWSNTDVEPYTGFSTTVSTNKLYIGTYTDFIEADEVIVKSKYNWVKVKGEKGDKGDNGIPGQAGADGQPTYVWIAYAASATGTSPSLSPNGKNYVGYAPNQTSSTALIDAGNIGKYQWQLVKGDAGSPGVGISSTIITYQTSTGGTSVPSGPWLATVPTVPPGHFLWTKTTFNYSNGTNASAYSVGKIGEQGTSGATGSTGAAGVGVTSTEIRYISHTSGTSIPTGTWLVNPPAVNGGNYLWTRTIISYSNATSSTSYSVGKMGEQGIKGNDGPQGIAGVKGADGKTKYTWIKYADSPTTGMADDPTGKKYIGMAFDKDVAQESTVYSQYRWSLMPQNINVGGSNYVQKSKNMNFDSEGYLKLIQETMGLTDPGDYVFQGIFENGQTSTVPSEFKLTTVDDILIGTYPMDNTQISLLYAKFKIEELHKYKGLKIVILDAFTSIPISNASMSFVKVEKGDIKTDWTPSNEDIEKELADLNDKNGDLVQITTTMRGDLNVEKDRITQEVINRESMGDTIRSETSSLITQRDDIYSQEFTRIETITNGTEVSLNELKTYYRYTANEAIVGKSGDPMQFYFSNNEAGYRENGQRISYWKGRKFFVQDLHVLASIIIGEHVVESQGGNTIVRSVS